MMNSRKRQLSIVLISACICVMTFGAEPNEGKTPLKFETGNEVQEWIVRIDGTGEPVYEERKEMLEGSFAPKYVAVFYIRGRQFGYQGGSGAYGRRSRGPTGFYADFSEPTWIKSVLSTSAGKSLSEHQVDLLHTGVCIRVLGEYGKVIGNHQSVRIYAVSEKDAQKTVEAFIEVLSEVNTTIQYLEHRQVELKEIVSKSQKDLSEKQAKLKSTRTSIEKLKETVHYLSTEEAQKIVLELNQTLNSLDVEIAGLQAKISTIADHIEKYRERKVRENAAALAKLEEMLNEESVELAGALARKEAATKIRNEAEQLCKLSTLENNLIGQMHNLERELSGSESELAQVRSQLAHPTDEMLPPNIFQNKVTIYPVERICPMLINILTGQ